MMAYWSTKHWFLIEDPSERMNFCLQWNADVVAKAGLWSRWTIVQSVEFVYNLQALHPSLSLMDGGFCGGIEQRALTQARGMALEEPPTSLTKIKETYIDSPIISGGGGVSKDMSGKRGLEYSAGVSEPYLTGFQKGLMATAEVRGEWECRSLSSYIAAGSVTLKAGRLKGLMGAKAMPCGVI